MLVDASVARSFAVVGWTRHLVTICDGCVRVAEGVHSLDTSDPSELRGIRDALIRQANQAGLGSGLASRALAAAHGLDELLGLDLVQLVVLQPRGTEIELAVRLQSRRPADRQWRQELGARSRRLDLGEAVTIAIASSRSLPFASDDDDALILWHALTGSRGRRTADLLHCLADRGAVADEEARQVYEVLQTDDLHTLGGPPW
jgi:hypothetical protein